MGVIQYLTETTPNYARPLQSHNVHPNIRACSTAPQIHTWNLENDLERQAWAVVNGFEIVIYKNVREALDLQYYEQIKQPTFGYKRHIFRDYIIHLKAHWCRLDVKTIKNIKQYWKHSWVSEENIV